MKHNIQHHFGYASMDNVMHRCLMTYLDMFNDMPPQWYIQNTYDSCSRKGYEVSMESIAKLFVLYRPNWKGKFILQNGSKFTLF